MKIFIKILLIVIAVFCINNTYAQSYTIDQGGIIDTCVGTFFDSGNNAGNYQNNENYIITFCSDGGGNSIGVGFATLFDIDPSDTLFVYDGNSTAAPLIGAYNNNNPLLGLGSSTANTSGCLTFHFVSDGAVVDTGWSAVINCATVCQPINPVITTIPTLVVLGPDSIYTNICPGDTVQFSAIGTYPDNGINPFNYTQSDATSIFEWSLGVGNPPTFGQNASEFYTTPQGYFITLKVTDVNGCQEIVSHKVRTGIPPVFPGVFAQPDTACFGDTINLIGGFNQTTTSPPGAGGVSGVVSAGGIVSGQTFLPDGSGQSYTTSVNIGGFPGQNIVNGTDIAEVCLNIEHSWIGDLRIQLTCPNGTSIDLSNTFASASPGGTFLGDANDDGSTTPGIGMDYCFDLGAAFGTMTTENNNNNWIPSTVTPGNNILTPGSFQPDQSFNNLIGCPIDGNWTITVTDNLSIDNGYIFEWSLLLNPAINPNAEFYDVDIIDGIWLNNPDFITNTDTIVTTLPNSSGVKFYTFQVTDEYGCMFDTTIQVVVLPELDPIASVDTTICLGQTVTLDVNTIDTCTYTLLLFDTFGDGWNNASLNVFVNGTPFLANITVANCGGSNCSATFNIPVVSGDIITMNYTSGSFDFENDITVFDGSGNQVLTINDPPAGSVGGNITAVCGALLGYVWNPSIGLNDATIKNPIFSGTAPSSSYTVTINHLDFPQCNATSDSITIVVVNDSIPVLSVTDSLICIGDSITLSLTNGTSILWPSGDTTLSVGFVPIADTTVTVTVNNFCGSYSFSQNIVVVNNPIPVLTGDSIICIGDGAALTINNASAILWASGDTTSIVNFIPSTDTTVIATASNFCDTINFSQNIIVLNNPIPTFSISDSLICIGDSVTLTINNATSILWPAGDTTSIINFAPGADTTVVVTANNFCDTVNFSQNIVVVNNPMPVLTGDSLICIGDAATLTISNASAILWASGDTTAIVNFLPSVDTTINATASNFCDTINFNKLVEVTQNTAPDILGDSIVCFGDLVSLTGTATDVELYLWPDSSSLSTVSFTPSADTLVVLYASNRCDTSITSLFIIVNPNPTITTTQDTSIIIQDSVGIAVFGGDTTSTFLWNPTSGLDCDTCTTPVAFPTETTAYTITVTDTNGCVTTETLTIEVLIPDLFIPTGFSPNNDGINDEVLVRSLDIRVMILQIFNRWGELVFETEDQTIGWDGTQNGQELDFGVYVYKFEATMLSGRKVALSGSITLFR